jgi:hypothetical protein
VSTKSVGARKSTATSPLFPIAQLSLANELLFARMQALVSLAIVLASEGFAANCTDKGPLVGMSAEMGA